MTEIVGSGLLRDAIAAIAPESVTVVIVSDGWDIPRYDGNEPFLPVRVELGRAVIGPYTVPGEPGCPACAQTRRNRLQPHAQADRRLWTLHHEALRGSPSTWLHSVSAAAVAALVVDELSAPMRRTRNAVLHVRLDTLEVSRHAFLPVPTCATCGRLPEDSAELATVQPQRRPKLAPSRFRTRDLLAVEDELLATYMDEEYGLIRAVTQHGFASFPQASAYLGPPEDPGDAGYGRTRDFRSCRITAVAEALERHGATPGGKLTTVRASYAELGDRALDPRTLGLYPDEWYDRPGFEHTRFHPDLELDWVWGYSFGGDKPVLVPETYAYYGKPGIRLAYEISNGCALGSNIEEATVYALLELLERDAFLLTWYARLPVPRLDLYSAADPTIPLLADLMETRFGYRVQAYNTTLEHGVPCFWVTAVDTIGGPDRPRLSCSAGSHFDPETGLLNALYELMSFVENTIATYPAQRAHCADLVADASLVRHMEDHHKVYWHPDAAHRLDFLLDAEKLHPLDEFADTWRWPEFDDLTDDLAELVSRFCRHGQDVIVVDQTTPEHRAGGFSCVKAIVPGLLPMTFGDHTRRFHGLPRVLELPYRLGYTGRALTEAELNHDPHPFP